VNDANPTLSWDLVRDVRELLAFPFMVDALEAATIVAVLAAVVGWFMVLRRQAFAGHTLATMAFPGAAGAALAGLPAAVGYYVACAAAALAIGVGRRPAMRGGESATVGAVGAAGLAAGFLFLSLDRAVLGGLESVLFGTVLGVTRAQVLTLLVVAAVVLAAVALVARPLLFATVDPDSARARGLPVRALDTGFLLLLGLAVAATSQITGVLLVFALLVAPPATAQELTARPGLGLALSVAIGLAVAWLGLGLAYFSVYPVGFFTTSIAFAAYLAARLARAARDRRGAARAEAA
jgi:zinc/manganese transport system permease protein